MAGEARGIEVVRVLWERRRKGKKERKEKREKEKKEKEERGKKKKRRWKGVPVKNRKAGRVAARTQGVGKQNFQGELGQTLGFGG